MHNTQSVPYLHLSNSKGGQEQRDEPGRHKDFDRFACTSSCMSRHVCGVGVGVRVRVCVCACIEMSLRKRLGTCLRCPEYESSSSSNEFLVLS